MCFICSCPHVHQGERSSRLVVYLVNLVNVAFVLPTKTTGGARQLRCLRGSTNDRAPLRRKTPSTVCIFVNLLSYCQLAPAVQRAFQETRGKHPPRRFCLCVPLWSEAVLRLSRSPDNEQRKFLSPRQPLAICMVHQPLL